MPGGTTGYVGTRTHNEIFPLDFVAQTVGSPITTTGNTPILFLQPGGSQIFIPDPSTNEVMVIDTATNLQVATVTLTGATAPTSGGFDSAGSTFFVAVPGSGDIFAIDTTAYTLGPTYSGLGTVEFLAIIPTVATVSEMIVMVI